MQLRLTLLFAAGVAASLSTACDDRSAGGGSGGTASVNGGATGDGAGSGATAGSTGSGAFAGTTGGGTTGAGAGGSSGSAGGGGTAGGGTGSGLGGVGTAGDTASDGSGLNECGVAAPLPAETGQCATVAAESITDFDDFAGGEAANYSFAVAAMPPAAAAYGAVLHVDDGSDPTTSVITTEMVPGVGGEGYALHISNSNATNWGGLLMLYVTGTATTLGCIDARAYGGIELTIKGSTPSGRVGINVSKLDTTPTADNGLCNNATSSDCKDATITHALPPDPEQWLNIEIPWSALTPGVGSDTLCVPDTGQNIVRLVVQPLMTYAPPDWTFAPGPYSLTVDDVRFYGEGASSSAASGTSGTGGTAGSNGAAGAAGNVEAGGAAGAAGETGEAGAMNEAGASGTAGSAGSAGTGGRASCDFPETLRWTSPATPLIAPSSDATHSLVAIKDPSIVRYGDRYHVYASSVSTGGAYNLVYTSFADWSEASTAPLYYLDQTPGFDTYVAAPQVFYFTPQNKWYLVYQSGPPMYSTTDDLGDPTTWTAPQPFYAATPAIITENGGGWLDYWVICNTEACYLFFSSNQGRWYRAKTAIGDFPNGFGDPVVVMQNNNSGRIFEASNVYKMNGTNKYLALIEAFDQTSGDKRYFRSWIAEDLEGPWLPWQASGSFPFAGARNVTFDGAAWTHDISHGEMIRAGYDETLAIEPCNLQFLYQGADPLADNMGDYNKIPWHLGLLTQAP